MKEAERKKAAVAFSKRWAGLGDEEKHKQQFWDQLLREVYGVTQHGYVTPEKDVKMKDPGAKKKTTRFIDLYIPTTKVLIEQKGIKCNLDAPEQRGVDAYGNPRMVTPYEQAQNYNNWLPTHQRANWIVTCNFAVFRIYDMEKPLDAPVEIKLEDLPDRFHEMDFLIDAGISHIVREFNLSIGAGALVGKMYDSLHKQYANPNSAETLHSLNVLCVRLVFCLYAENAGLFKEHDSFRKFIASYRPENLRGGLRDLFTILDTPVDQRDPDDEEKLLSFPYVNGGLFTSSQKIKIPRFSQEAYDILLHDCAENFNWAGISPTIFGAVFEGTLNSEIRRQGGMHYTSIENIHKVIDPLFLNELREELNEIEDETSKVKRNQKLDAYQNKLASLHFLDPACGSGNFLTETYLSLRKLENEALRVRYKGEMFLGVLENPIKVSISQFHGIEINDFAVAVAKTALWIAESQMMQETREIVTVDKDFLPLKTNAGIHEGNALRMDWSIVVDKNKLSYIMGNPPFVGLALRTENQQIDMDTVFSDNKRAGRLDYVAAWYKKAAVYITGTLIEAAFVSTNSICQGEQVPILWEDLFNNHNIKINFAYRTFSWNNEAKDKASVHCVIIGFSNKNRDTKLLFDEGQIKYVDNINGYLVNADNVFIRLRGKARVGLPKLVQGNKPWDGGFLLLSVEEKNQLISKYPKSELLIKRFVGSYEFINNKMRYCLWLKDVSPNEYRNIPEIMNRLEGVTNIRRNTKTIAVQAQAQTPMLFSQIRQPDKNYILIPETSSSNRKYIPIGFMSKDIIASNSTLIATDATLYLFGILTSNVHMSWVKTVCGRLKSDYRYSPSIYNNFPWPQPTEKQKAKIETTAQEILNTRKLFSNASLADLYDEVAMPPELRKAHKANDRAVMEAYGMWGNVQSEGECVAWLFKMYEELSNSQL